MDHLVHLYIGDARALYIGPSFDAELHSHHAIQVAIGIDSEIKFSADGNEFLKCESVLIGSDVEHAVRCGEGRVAMLYAEPEYIALETDDSLTSEGKPFLINPIDIDQDSLACVTDPNGLLTVCNALCQSAGLVRRVPESLDARIASTIATINRDSDRCPSIQCLASDVSLSEPRLSHLFTQETGIALRSYLLWRRLREAIRHAGMGAKLVDASLSAGFSDAAHFSRTFKRMFGVQPSFLFADRSALKVEFSFETKD